MDTNDHDAPRLVWSSLQLTGQADIWHATGASLVLRALSGVVGASLVEERR